jgi:hypothetical protein
MSSFHRVGPDHQAMEFIGERHRNAGRRYAARLCAVGGIDDMPLDVAVKTRDRFGRPQAGKVVEIGGRFVNALGAAAPRRRPSTVRGSAGVDDVSSADFEAIVTVGRAPANRACRCRLRYLFWRRLIPRHQGDGRIHRSAKRLRNRNVVHEPGDRAREWLHTSFTTVPTKTASADQVAAQGGLASHTQASAARMPTGAISHNTANARRIAQSRGSEPRRSALLREPGRFT